MPRGAAVIRYKGKRGTVWRVKYLDADGRQVQETIGAERDGVTRKQAEAELRERLVRVDRKGYRRPRGLTFGEHAETWFESGKRSQGWKPATVKVYRNVLDAYLVPWFGSTRLDAIRTAGRVGVRHGRHDASAGEAQAPADGEVREPAPERAFSIFKSAIGEELVDANPVARSECVPGIS